MTGRSGGRAWMARLVTPPVAVVAVFLMTGTALAAPTWTGLAIPLIADTSLLFGVSCHTWGTCIGVGYDIQRGGAFPLAEHES